MEKETKFITRIVAGTAAVGYLYIVSSSIGGDLISATKEYLPPPDIVLTSGQIAIPGSVTTTQFVRATAKDDAFIFFADATESPTLQEFLSKFTCSGCSKACLLTSPTCINGETKNEQAIVIYQEMYPDMEI